MGTTLRVRPKDWSTPRGRLKPSVPGAAEVNGELERLTLDIWRLSLEFAENEALREAVLRRLGRLPEQASPSVLELYEEFFEMKSLRVQDQTLPTYKALREHLHAAYPDGLTTDEIGADFFEDFVSHLLRAKHGNTNINKNTQRLKSFLQYLRRQGNITDIPERQALPTIRKEIYALTMKELGRIVEFDLTGAPIGTQHARDLFVFGAHTGQRFSDLQAMSWEDLDQERWLWLSTSIKTGATRRIPIIGRARTYLERRVESARPLPKLSSQKTNENIKEIALAANITRMVSKVFLSGSVREREILPLHEAISFQVSRKTFVTLMLQGTGDLTSVLAITHDDLKSAQQYIQTDPELQALQAEETFAAL